MNVILLIEDDVNTACTLQALLLQSRYFCDLADNLEEGSRLAKCKKYDLIILDLLFAKEKICAHDFIWKLRLAKVKAPIVILSAVWSIESKVRSLGFGADDYIVKPYNPSELVARIQAITRRCRGLNSSVCKYGPLAIYLDSKEVFAYDKPVILTSKEYAILEKLAVLNRVVCKDELLVTLYGGIDEPEIKIIDVFVCKLRKKLKKAAKIECIETVWGRGYQLNRFLKSMDSQGETEKVFDEKAMNFTSGDIYSESFNVSGTTEENADNSGTEGKKVLVEAPDAG